VIQKAIQFLKHDLWTIPLEELPKGRSFLLRQLRILVITIRDFTGEKIQQRASALTYYTLLSVVPVVAMAFGIAKGFGFQDTLREKIIEGASSNKEVFLLILDFAESYLNNAKGGIVAGVGILVLVWSVIRVLSNVEESFNTIWRVKSGRSWTRKFTDYLTIMLLGPMFILFAGSINVFISTNITALTDALGVSSLVSPFVEFLLSLSPYFIIWLVFTFLYMIMPNTKVSFKSALIAGIIGGTIFQLFEKAYIYFQMSVSSYNAIYGSFAALPLFLLWLQTSWTVVLLGAEISFANQNVKSYAYERLSSKLSRRFQDKLALLILHKMVHRFKEGVTPYSSSEISEELGTGFRVVRNAINALIDAGLVMEVGDSSDKFQQYGPACDVHDMTVVNVLRRLGDAGSDDYPISRNKTFKAIEMHQAEVEKAMISSEGNVKLLDI